MLRKGIVERNIESLGIVLAYVLGVKETGESAAARTAIRNASKELTGLDWNLLQTMSAESILALLKTNGVFDGGKCLVIAVLLHEHGILDEEVGLAPVALVEYKKAFRLLGEAIQHEAVVRTPEFTTRMADLMRRIKELTPKP